MDANKIKEDFPFFQKNQNWVYLDSACTSLKPKQVITAELDYYENVSACASRSSHSLGRKATEAQDSARARVASFINSNQKEVIFTRNTTEGLNLAINSLDFSRLGKKKIVTTVLEHHSVLLPLFNLRNKNLIDLKVLECDSEGLISLDQWNDAINSNTALIVTNSSNNTLGTSQPTGEIAKIAHDSGAFICIDGAQGVAHQKTDFKKDDYDFLCFSGHKMLGPTGIGCLVAKSDLQKSMKPLVFGGGTVKTVSLEKAEFLENYEKFEAGIQNYAGAIGFGVACDYLKKIGMENINGHEKKLAAVAIRALEEAGALIYGSKEQKQSALISFNLKNAKPHDVALMLDKFNIAVRSGFFCAQPAMEAIGAKEGAVRLSAYLYNTEEDLTKFKEILLKVNELYS
ncbi:cysteine desulfurase [Candidatus Micrarchaeota archaeon]|nr:cysteine desulfurase [Candidatus Micrarchaeota archaeon]